MNAKLLAGVSILALTLGACANKEPNPLVSTPEVKYKTAKVKAAVDVIPSWYKKMPDKKFKHQNPATEKVKSRHGFVYEKRKSAPVKGSLGKKTYKSDWIKGHRAHQRMGLIKD